MFNRFRLCPILVLWDASYFEILRCITCGRCGDDLHVDSGIQDFPIESLLQPYANQVLDLCSTGKELMHTGRRISLQSHYLRKRKSKHKANSHVGILIRPADQPSQGRSRSCLHQTIQLHVISLDWAKAMSGLNPWLNYGPGVLRPFGEESNGICTVTRAEGVYKIPTFKSSVSALCTHLYEYGLACQDDLIETPDGILLKSSPPSGHDYRSLGSSQQVHDCALKQLFPKGNVRVTVRRKPWLQKNVIKGKTSQNLSEVAVMVGHLRWDASKPMFAPLSLSLPCMALWKATDLGVIILASCIMFVLREEL